MAGRVGVWECRGMRDGIDGKPLCGHRKTAENKIGASVKERSSVGGAGSRGIADGICKGCAAGDKYCEHTIEVGAGQRGNTRDQHGRGNSRNEPGERGAVKRSSSYSPRSERKRAECQR